jgi:hypothetical protein
MPTLSNSAAPIRISRVEPCTTFDVIWVETKVMCAAGYLPERQCPPTVTEADDACKLGMEEQQERMSIVDDYGAIAVELRGRKAAVLPSANQSVLLCEFAHMPVGSCASATPPQGVVTARPPQPARLKSRAKTSTSLNMFASRGRSPRVANDAENVSLSSLWPTLSSAMPAVVSS